MLESDFLKLDRDEDEQVQQLIFSEDEEDESSGVPFSTQALAELAVDLSSKLVQSTPKRALRLGDSFKEVCVRPRGTDIGSGLRSLSASSASRSVSRVSAVPVASSEGKQLSKKRRRAGAAWFGMESFDQDQEYGREMVQMIRLRGELDRGRFMKNTSVGDMYQIGTVTSGAHERYNRAARKSCSILDQALNKF
jgi:hypothetical protein